MEKQNDIVIISGTACGPKAGARARRCDPHARITIVEQQENLSVASCGLPYYVSRVIDSQSELVTRKPDFFKDVLSMDVLTRTRALSIDRKTHCVETLNLETNGVSKIKYDKLVVATGSIPTVLALEGGNLEASTLYPKSRTQMPFVT